jgi:ribosomal protein L37AE/L43A
MPSFKHKTNKKIILDEKSITTLDSKHREIETEFSSDKQNMLPELRAKKKYLAILLKDENMTIDKKIEIKDMIYDITKQINDLKKKSKNYYLNNNKYIFDYFENKKDISMNNNKTKLLNSFFKISTENEEQHSTVNRDNIQKYLSNLDETFIDINKFIVETDICQFCKKGELIAIDHEGIMVCNHCHKHIQYLVENEKPSYKEPPKEACFYAYKRINHFREILAQFQAKETTQIPEEVLENIKNQIRKERIDLTQLNNKKAKDILKKLGYNKYYEHIPFIKDKLGIKPPVMTQELEESLCNLFMEIQGPYAKFCPDDRVNFLNYYYTVYKLCELLDQGQFLPYFPMLKDREKRIEQDEIWKKICQSLDWEFIPTI